ncbi:34755_t:CDS:1, partial [Racocetra persica]
MSDALFFDINDYIYFMSDNKASIDTNNNKEVTEVNELDLKNTNEPTYLLVETEEDGSDLESEYEDTESIF